MSAFLKIFQNVFKDKKKNKNNNEKKRESTGKDVNTDATMGQVESRDKIKSEEKDEKTDTDTGIKTNPRNAGKLYVGDLSLITSSKDLEAYFSRFGRVADAVVMKHPKTGKSRGFGFVTFTDPASSEKALQLKFHELDGKTVEIRYFVPEKPQKSHHLRVFLGGLHFETTEDDLAEFFERYGEVTYILINRDKITNQSKGFGFIEFKDESSVEKCLADGFVFLKGKKVQMKKAEPRECSLVSESSSFCSESNMNVLEGMEEDCFLNDFEERKETESLASGGEALIEDPTDDSAVKKQTKQKSRNSRKLFVGGLNHVTTCENLKAYFSRFGKVSDAVVKKFPKTGKSRGFGFVTFAGPASAEKALQSKFHELDGKTVEVRYFGSEKPQKSHHLRVFLGGLPFDISNDDLSEVFKKYGEVTDILINRDKITNQSKGFGFIGFKDESSVEKCLADGFVFLKGKKVQMKKAEPRECSLVSESSSFCSESNMNVLEGMEEDCFLNDFEERKETESLASGGEALIKNLMDDSRAKKQTKQMSRNSRKLFVGGLNHVTTCENLKDYFSRFGKVSDAVVMKFPKTGKSRGFGFVTFAGPASAEKALQSKFHELDGKTVEVRYFGSEKPQKSHHLRVILKGLPFDISNDDLSEVFKKYGEVTDILINRDKITNQSKGFGFIGFKDESSVEKCLADGFVFLKGKKVQMKKAEPRECSLVSESSSFCSESNMNVLEGMEEDCFLNDFEERKETESLALGEEPTKRNVQELLDYFFTLPALLKSMNVEEKDERDDVKNLEKFLSMSSVEECSEENLIKFSDDSEESGSEENDYSGTSDDGFTVSDVEASSEEITAKIMEALASRRNCNKIPDSVRDDGGFENPSLPLTFEDSTGSLRCSLCSGPLSSYSSESFLAHCRTPEHKAKLRERFQDDKPDFVRSSEQAQKIETSAKTYSSKKKEVAQTNVKPQSETIVKNDNKWTVKKNVPEKQIAKKPQSEAATVSNTQINTSHKKSKRRQKVKNLKAQVLQKGIESIRLIQGNELKCQMCNVTLPPSTDFSISMKVIAEHLQSKKHLKKLLGTENLLKEKEEKNQEKKSDANKISQKTPSANKEPVKKVPGNTNSANKEPVKKVSGNTNSANKEPVKKVSGNTNSANKEPVKKVPANTNSAKENEKPKNLPATALDTKKQKQKSVALSKPTEQKLQGNSVAPKSATNFPEKKNVPEMKPNISDNSFLCLPCKLSFRSIGEFHSHETSKSHSVCVKTAEVNIHQCRFCEKFLYGSRSHFVEHYSKCVT